MTKNIAPSGHKSIAKIFSSSCRAKGIKQTNITETYTSHIKQITQNTWPPIRTTDRTSEKRYPVQISSLLPLPFKHENGLVDEEYSML